MEVLEDSHLVVQPLTGRTVLPGAAPQVQAAVASVLGARRELLKVTSLLPHVHPIPLPASVALAAPA
jgi:hypothetical protein